MRDWTGNVARVHTGTETRAFDRRAIEELAIPGIRLMLRAGRAAFDALRERWPDAEAVTVVCGAGNNAGDGYVVAALAKDAGLAVQIIEVGDPAKVVGDALAARQFARERVGATSADGWPIRGDVVVDALLGTGSRGRLRAPYQDAAARINAAGKPVLALDVPTGVDADTGGLLADAPVRADLTVTFVALKLGLVTGPAVDYVGELRLDDLGIAPPADAGTGVRVATGAGLAALARSPGAHKGDFGRLLIVGGDADMGGAVLLAGEAALRAGAGIVTIATRAAHRPAILARRPELMVRAVEAAQDLRQAAQSATAIVVGPGLGRGAWSRLALTECLTAAAPLVVDADGLNLLADDAGPSLSDLPEGSIVTPHPGEAGRLLGSDAAAVQGGRPGAAVALSANGVVAVLKGAGTLVAEDGALRAICLRGNPHMATAGSGDVLSGVIGALRARGLPAGEAAELGVWLHARAGDEAAAGRESAVLAGDIAAALRLTS